MIDTVAELNQEGMAINRACILVGLPRAAYYRRTRGYQHYQPVATPIPHTQRHQPAALSAAERESIINILDHDDYADLSVQQTYWRAFDAGQIACSQRTFYRVAQAAALVGDRRRCRRRGTSRRPPSAAATRPNQLWSWDATELPGPGTQRYKLILVIDVYSRYPIGWRIEYHESREHAINLFSAAINRHGRPQTVHADNGAPMRAHKLIAMLEHHDVVTSYSRPRVSDDNPFSESMFKTIKYDLDCPEHFDNIDHARAWTDTFLTHYATEHRHSGLAHHTPASVYHGRVDSIRAQRQAHLDAYWKHHPERFRNQPTAPKIKPTGINPHLSQTG